MIRVERFDTISSIEETAWDSIISPNEFLNSYRFIKTVEESRMENSSLWYLLFYDGQQLVGHSVLSCFTISLDLFIPRNKLALVIKKAFPHFFNVRILFSGLPASLAQLNLKIKDVKWQQAVNNALSNEMHSLAKKLRVNLLCVKEFKGVQAEICEPLIQNAFFRAFSLPYMTLAIRWQTFSDFVNQMRHPYRRSVVRSLRKMNSVEPIILKSNIADPLHQWPVLVLGDKTLCPPRQMHMLYLSVMARTPTKLETLNLAFFENFYEQFGGILQVLTVQYRGKILSAALLLNVQDELTFILLGRENDKDPYDSYFNLVYGIVQLGIQQKVSTIKMGQTAYWVKQRVGALPEPVYIYFKSRRSLINLLLKKFNRLIFPELNLAPIRIFNERPVNAQI
jgi:predicted N-acyltransferase